MITVKQFNDVKRMIAAYWSTLELGEVKSEFARKGLLTQNTKLAKGSNYNMGLELLPSVLAPHFNACPGAGACRYSCLAFSGAGNVIRGPKMLASGELNDMIKFKARKSFLYLNDQSFFEAILRVELQRHSLIAGLEGKTFGARLNTTSDVDWKEFTESMPEIRFYDYTKVWDRGGSTNYHLTYSASELTADTAIKAKLRAGHNVAVVFPSERPATHLGYPVINGDTDDDRYDDPRGVIVGLSLKVTIGGGGKTSPLVRG